VTRTDHQHESSTATIDLKRPVSLYFVVAWCFLGMAYASTSIKTWIASVVSPDQAIIFQRQVGGVLLILILWHVFRLTQLRAFNRWLTFSFFTYWTVVLAWNAFVLIPHTNNTARAAVPFILFATLNLTCIWYLTRHSFRDFAAKFVAEREREKRLRNFPK
jgi:hypothetical protein